MLTVTSNLVQTKPKHVEVQFKIKDRSHKFSVINLIVSTPNYNSDIINFNDHHQLSLVSERT